ncbi:glycosyltransferase [Yersinia ruckeri]|uniref:glycosyltransferase n=1 Tax=Yersinia ruckeri TaxID=29486 RepID=UPI002238C073|nr:glycosyltransferase [Yersinia ruckeri]MCW6543627.1 glycosyltransferase [Yersinia ruckeri]MCW6590749.1 glycosyltransferase [Yersinia ruckeri]UZX91952.1 glycosyltransferase [Yersinia ruckeri]
MRKIDISIIVPVFNGEAYLSTLLDSLSNQTGVSIEIIAVNDGSSDKSAQILANHALNDPRIQVIHQSNQGLSVARNTGIRYASGQWIAFADCDDWLAPEALKTWLTQATAQQLEMLIGNGYSFTTDPNPALSPPLLHKQTWGMILDGSSWIIHCVEQQEWPHYAWLQLIRREFIVTHQFAFIPQMLHEDILWTTYLALAAQRIGFCATPFYGYRTNPQSITQTPSPQTLQRRAESYLAILSALINTATTAPARLRRALLRHINQESGHLFGLLRKKITSPPVRTQLAKQFIALKLPRLIWLGAVTPREYWRAIRCILFFRLCVRQKHQ